MICLSTVQKVAKNTGIIIAGDVIFRLISLFVMIFLARYLDPVGFGKYSFVFAYLAFFGVLADLGLRQILVREMSRDLSMMPKLIGNAYIIALILAIFATLLSIITIWLMSYPADTTTYVYIAAFTLFFISLSEFYSTIFQANLRMEYNVIAKLSFKFVSAALIFWIIFSHGTLMQILGALVFSEAIKTSISYYYSRKFVKPKLEIDFGLWKYLLKESLPIALSGAIIVIYHYTDIVMLSVMQGDAAVGIYSAAYKLVEPLNFIPYALMLSLFPVMSESFKSSRERLIKVSRLGFKSILLIMLPVVICVAILADEIIALVYGELFTASVSVLGILSGVLIFSSLNIVMGNMLIAINRQTLRMFSLAIGTAINVLFNFLLIPMFSYNGAAIVTLITNIVIFTVNFYFVSKSMNYSVLIPKTLKPVVCGLIMGIALFSLKDIGIGIVPLLSLGIIIYFVGLYLLKVLTKGDIELFKKAIMVIRGKE